MNFSLLCWKDLSAGVHHNLKRYLSQMAIVGCVFFITPTTSSEKPSSQCSECPVDVSVGADQSCDSATVTEEEVRYITLSWHEVPVIDWTCEDLSNCESGECSHCSAFVEIQLMHLCHQETLTKHRPAYGLVLSYADPLASTTLRHYLAPPVRVPDRL